MSIDYDHDLNTHTIEGARAVLSKYFDGGIPRSVLDVGCGRGMWLRAVLDFGVTDVQGIDGVDTPEEKLQIPKDRVLLHDLGNSWDLARQFDLVLCLEVAEHLDSHVAETLIKCLCRHGDTVLFSAAIPGQAGQHHVNCQWPSYWQELFNAQGFACFDSVRWKIWENGPVEPWYRQNIFVARKDKSLAGHEPRIMSVIHPVMLGFMGLQKREEVLAGIEAGSQRIGWYFGLPVKAVCAKVWRRFWNKQKKVENL